MKSRWEKTRDFIKNTKRNYGRSKRGLKCPKEDKKTNAFSRFFISIYCVLRNIFHILRLFLYYELLYFAHLRTRLIHDHLYRKSKAYKKTIDYKYTRTIRRASVAGFIVSFMIFQLLGSLWPEFFGTGPQVAHAGNSSVTWTSEGNFDGTSPPSGAMSGADVGPEIDLSSSSGDVRLRYDLNWDLNNTLGTIVPLARRYHTAVWTGSKMIVWGGDNVESLNTGGIYDPATDTWTATSTTGAPSARNRHTAVWTGSKMIVWGGDFNLNTGGIYDPATDTWTATSTTNAPSARMWHTAVWTGTKMIVWGGNYYSGGWQDVNTGGIYDPATNTWTAISTTGAPSARNQHTAIWTGSKMIVWGGSGGSYLNTGGIYDPTTDTWTATSTTGAPSGRYQHTAIWTGSKMVVWGGSAPITTNTGGIYDPATDTWTATSITGAPSARYAHTAIWTGSKMIVWGGNGGSLNTGGLYDPSTDTWISTTITSVPTGRSIHTAVWTGSKMIVWGGNGISPTYKNDGGIYDPVTDTWTATLTTGAPFNRVYTTAVWTGSKIIIWGGCLDNGDNCNSRTNTGGIYDPATDTWTATSTTGAPAARGRHTAIWTGSKMIVWGGRPGYNTGGIYDPATDTWTTTSTTNAPSARYAHTAIWTGSKMIVWGGDNVGSLNTGGIYDPATDTWTAISTTGAPSARNQHTAIWTGSKMIVWGGIGSTNTGGIYDPATDTWTTTSTTNAPSARYAHTAIWTGSKMIVWGGNGSSPTYKNDGGIYDPVTDTWTTTSTTNAPSMRMLHTAIWTGSKMIVWGGYNGSYLNTGGIYDPATDTWTATSTTGAPSARGRHTAVWTGSKMMVWGGDNGGSLNTGGIYGSLFSSSGIISSLKVDTGVGARVQWTTLIYNADALPAGTTLTFETRGSDNGSSWTGWQALSGSNIQTGASRYLEIKLTLTSDGGDTPILHDFNLSYDTLDSVLNSNLTLTKTDDSSLRASSGSVLGAGTPDGWTNETSVKLTASGLACTGCGSSTNIRPEVEIKPLGTTFDETGTFVATQGSTSATMNGLSVGTSYHLRARAIDDEGKVSPWTSYGGNAESEADVSVENTPPSQPGIPTVGGSQTGDSTPTWTWSASTDAGSGVGYYKVYWDTVAGGTTYSDTSATNSFTHTTPLTEDTWYMKVEAYDNAGTVSTVSGNGSALIDITSPDVGSITAKTDSGGSNITASSWQSDNDPYFSWDAPPDASGIAGYYYAIDDATPESGGTWTTNTNIQYGNDSFPEGAHTFYVRAKDNAGNEAGTMGTFVIWADSVTPSLALDPAFTFTASDNNTDDVTLSWGAYTDSGSSVDHYAIERVKYSDYDVGGHGLTSNWSTESSYYSLGDKTGASYINDTGTDPEDIASSVRYVYRIKVIDSAGNGSEWLILDDGMTSDSVSPSSPSNVTVSACNGVSNCSNVLNKGYELKLSWTTSTDTGSGVTGYKIYRKATSNSTSEGDFALVGYLDVNPPGAPTSTVYYDNDTGNDATFADATYDPDSETGGIQNIKTSATDRLNDYVNYYYRVTAVDEAGNSTDVITLDGMGMPTSVNYGTGKTVDITVPSVPQDIVATPMGLDSSDVAQRVDITWAASSDTRTAGRTPTGSGSGIAGYKVLECQGDSAYCSNDGNYSEVGTSSGITYTREGLSEFSQYYYEVVAVDKASSSTIADAGNNSSARSASVSATTASNTVPTVPLEVTVTSKKGDPNTDSDVGHQNTVTFKGSYAKNCSGGERCITGYEIYRSTDNFASDSLKIVDVSLGPVSDERGVTYTYIDNNSTNDSTMPSISRSFGGSPTASKAQTAHLSDATVYYYKVKAKDNTPANPDGGPFSSGLSSVTTGTLYAGWDATPDATAPDVPQGVTVKDIHPNESMARNILTWTVIADSQRNGSSDFSKYRVYRYETLLGIGTAALISEKTDRGDNYYVDGIPNADKSKDYSYYVVSVDNAGTDYKYGTGTIVNSTSNVSDHIVAVSINPSLVNPTVSGVQVSSTGVSSATISWSTNQNTDSLVEYREKNSDDVVAAGKDRTQPTVSHSIDIRGLEKGTIYEYRIVSRNSLGNIDESAATTWKEFTTQNFTISDTSVDTTTTTAKIKWSTNIASDSSVEYKLENSNQSSEVVGASGLLVSHEVLIKGLKPNNRYTYKIRSVTADKYIAETSFSTFATQNDDLNKFVVVPAESNVSEKNITATTTKITWVTAVPTTSWVEYGTQKGSYTMSAGDDSLNTTHAVDLENLRPGTTYFYRVKGKDINNIEYFSPESSFTAILMPEIYGLRVSEASSYSATVVFDTNVDALVDINYGKDTSYGQKISKDKVGRNHIIEIGGLEDNSTYHFQVTAVDQFKNEAKSQDVTFDTPLDTKGPEIYEKKVEIMTASGGESSIVVISWKTDKSSTSQVEYDDGKEEFKEKTVENSILSMTHTVLIKDLYASTNYRYRIVSKDKRGNTTRTKAESFITPTEEKSLLQIIIKSFEDTFSWVGKLHL